MLFELLKNSLRAVVERFGVENENDFPPIKVIVVEGKEDITIKISDEGGGIPRSEMGLVWTYMYTTAQSEDLGELAPPSGQTRMPYRPDKRPRATPLTSMLSFRFFIVDPDFNDSDFKAPMAGFGYGLPLARLVSSECECRKVPVAVSARARRKELLLTEHTFHHSTGGISEAI